MKTMDTIDKEVLFLQYQIVSSRREGTNSLMWQVPVLSLTAQSFLFGVALAPNASRYAQIMAAGLALTASLASIQLMAKHRRSELRDSIWLEKFERRYKDLGLQVLHAPWPSPEGGVIWRVLTGMSSYKVWMIVLSIFAVAALIVLFYPL